VIAAGQSIGNYRILSKIGTGGMGAVFLAEHPLIGKRVALKVIHRELAGNREVVQRFYQEARSVNKIGNEHIVEVHDFGVTPEGDHFYIMEYLEGKTLAAVLQRERSFPVMRALHIGAQMASALAAAHANGIIHRDLKPDNIMLMTRLGDPDFVKVLDFGLAKVFSAATAVKTAAGVLLGTPQYMSPEACESKREIDHRTDIYALGVLLFQMMTGVLPFDGQTMGEVLIKQVTALPPAPRGINPSIPPSVEQVLLRCLAKPPDARFPTMQALRDALLDPEAYLRASPPMSPARSVAPGEGPNAAAVAAYAAQHAASQQKTQIAGGPALPLPAPGAPTMIGAGLPPEVRRALPGMQAPNEPRMNTMRIATPMGYSSRPQRKIWPIVVGIGLLVGLGGGAFAVVYFGSKGGGAKKPVPDAAVVAAPTPDAAIKVVADAAVVVLPDAALPAPDAAAIVVVTSKLSIDTQPEGAALFGPDGASLGKTPIALEWPKSADPIQFELRMPGYQKKTLSLAITGNTAMHVDLVRAPSAPPPPHTPPHTAPDNPNGLERPE
jgi:serine/threonine-protein kinase